MNEDLNGNWNVLEGGKKYKRKKGGKLQQNKGWKWEVGTGRG